MGSKQKIKPRLVIIEGKDKGKIIPLADGTAIIGRTKGDVVIQDARVSRSHIAVHYDQKTEKLTFTDLKSLNGTLLNGNSIETGELHDGDRLQLGNTIFDCQLNPIDEETSVSKIKDQLKRQKEEAKEAHAREEKAAVQEAQSGSEEISNKEPELLPLEEESEALKQLLNTGRRADKPGKNIKSDTEESPRPVTKPSRKIVTASGLHAAYRRFPPRARIAALALIFFLVAFLFLFDNGTPSEDKIVKAVASVNKLISQNQLEDALKQSLRLKEKYPKDSRPYMLLGNIYALQEKNELSMEAFVQAHQLPPAQPLVHVKLIRILLRSGFTKEAENELAHIDQIIKEGKGDRDLFIEAAHLFLEFRELNQPLEKALILAKALQIDLAPKSTIGYKLEAQALFQKKMFDEAVRIINLGLKLDSKDEWLLENLAFAQLSLHDGQAAITTVGKWIDYHPTASKALLVMAYLKFNANQADEAQPFVDRILDNGRLNPKDSLLPEGFYLKGQILWKANRMEEAANHFRQACQTGFTKACSPELASTKGASSGTRSEQSLKENPPPNVPQNENVPTNPPPSTAPSTPDQTPQ